MIEEIQLPHSTQFAEKWKEWIEYKKEIKDSYKSPKSATAKAKQLAQYSEQVAIQMIDQSIADGYKGIFPLKTTNGKQVEPTQTYTEPKKTTISPYKAKPVDQNKVNDFILGKIKEAYEGNTYLNDAGGVYTNRLKHLLDTPTEVRDRIRKEAEELAAREPSNRFEEKVEINVELEIRNRILRYNLDKCRAEGRDLSEEL